MPCSRRRSSFGLLNFLFMMLTCLTPTVALQHSYPLARLSIDSSAVQTDRDIGSGDGHFVHGSNQVPCSVPLATTSCPCEFCPHFQGTLRYGEALHPGPHGEHLLTVGVSNPGGVRQKEDAILALGAGMWSLAEAQLSSATFRTSAHLLRTAGRRLNRAVRFHGGTSKLKFWMCHGQRNIGSVAEFCYPDIGLSVCQSRRALAMVLLKDLHGRRPDR